MCDSMEISSLTGGVIIRRKSHTPIGIRRSEVMKFNVIIETNYYWTNFYCAVVFHLEYKLILLILSPYILNNSAAKTINEALCVFWPLAPHLRGAFFHLDNVKVLC